MEATRYVLNSSPPLSIPGFYTRPVYGIPSTSTPVKKLYAQVTLASPKTFETLLQYTFEGPWDQQTIRAYDAAFITHPAKQDHVTPDLMHPLITAGKDLKNNPIAVRCYYSSGGGAPRIMYSLVDAMEAMGAGCPASCAKRIISKSLPVELFRRVAYGNWCTHGGNAGPFGDVHVMRVMMMIAKKICRPTGEDRAALMKDFDVLDYIRNVFDFELYCRV